MKHLENKVAFITGAASGIGRSLALECAKQGMKIVAADIDRSRLNELKVDLNNLGAESHTLVCDVSKPDSVQNAAQETLDHFGAVHFLVNNAGVLVTGNCGQTALSEWRRAVEINLMGVVHGVETFLPLIRKHGEGGHILNTASVGGHVGFAGVAPYSATKFAVVGYTEALASELESENIGVSMLCPGFTRTHIAESDSNAGEALHQAVDKGMSPDVVARFAIEQVKLNALYIFTHPGTQEEVEQRYPRITEAFQATRNSEIINSDPDAKRLAVKSKVEDLYR